jgi:hypothetical protein
MIVQASKGGVARNLQAAICTIGLAILGWLYIPAENRAQAQGFPPYFPEGDEVQYALNQAAFVCANQSPYEDCMASQLLLAVVAIDEYIELLEEAMEGCSIWGSCWIYAAAIAAWSQVADAIYAQYLIYVNA